MEPCTAPPFIPFLSSDRDLIALLPTRLEISLEPRDALVVVGVEHGDEAVPHVEHREGVPHHRRHVQHLKEGRGNSQRGRLDDSFTGPKNTTWFGEFGSCCCFLDA